jgi:hypothetical protein
MFEISGDDVTSLSDADLRCLVRRLATAELRAKGCPLSGVTAGGDQDAPDGGIDVRVECPIAIASPDFVPRPLTGFQVKKQDMPASAIQEEMRPKDVLRDVIRELAEVSGAYIVVSAQGSVADKPLKERRAAMRVALNDLPTAAQLHTDFYDRDRLASWINEYPGIAAWVRSRIGRPLSGWSGIGDWEGAGNTSSNPYLFNDEACLIEERPNDRKPLSIAEGIVRLRSALRIPKQCIRLIGLSGLGKTRLVQALFEEGIGKDPLDSSSAVYTDYSEETVPTARDMARDLVALGQHAILVVDNCNPSTHSELARLCSIGASKVSLITIEYDVRDDEPEHTEVFRLQSASAKLVTEWIKQNFPEISQIDREKIGGFSDGNFRVARALAETLGKGETLGSLRSRELFKRIFQQRNEPDQGLLRAAEDLSLLYSIEGEDVSAEGELACVGTISDINAKQLFGALVEMRRRGVVQCRGRFRAILPQAIANPLAAYALERIPSAAFDQFCAALTPRMLKSVSRRLGFLHDSTFAQAAVARWLRNDGPLGEIIETREDRIQIITNIAPVAPEAVLAKLEQTLEGSLDNVSGRFQWIRLIKALGYDAYMFERVMTLLARVLASEPENNNVNSARAAFPELFHLYLSGTQATPEQRRTAIKKLALSGDPALRRCASIALDALLESQHFTSMGSFDFGARSRDWGWRPKINKDTSDWFDGAIALAIELEAALPDVREILARHVRGIWHIASCHEALEHAATTFAKEKPWIDGWFAFRSTLRFDGKDMPEVVRERLKQIINQLKPSDLLHLARAAIINRTSGGWDIADGEADDGDPIRSWQKADKFAQEVGRSLSSDAAVRSEFLAELLVEPQAQRAFECGRGLAEGTNDLGVMWHELVTAYFEAEPKARNATVHGGFLYQAHQRDPSFARSTLDAVIDNPLLTPLLPYLQARIGIDDDGIARLRRAIAKGVLKSENFRSIANGVVSNSPPDPLGDLLDDIANLPDGVVVALDILSMHFPSDKEERRNPNKRLVAVGRDLLVRVDFSRQDDLRDFSTHTVIRVCLAGEEARGLAEKVCVNIRSAYEGTYFPPRNLNYVLQSLFEIQSFVALDTLLHPTSSSDKDELFESNFARVIPINNIDPTILQTWAARDPVARYPALGKCVPMFGKKNHEEENDISPLFMSLLEQAPDKRLFFGDFWRRLHPGSWSGSLADILIARKTHVMKFAEHSDEQVRAWAIEMIPEIDQWIEHTRVRERQSEESFE